MSAAHFDLRSRLATGEPFLFTWMTVPSAPLAGQVARLPIEAVCLDMQHGMIGFSDAAPMIAAINAAGRPAMVRALWNDAATPGQAFDAGAVCVIAPMVNTRKQAEALVRAAKYPPLGARSWGGYTALQASGLAPAEYLRQANRMTMVFAMVETVEALSNVNEIAKTPGLDGLFVGPSDLSITLSKGKKIDKTGKDTLAAMKGRYGPLGSPLFHWSLTALFVVVALGNLTRSEGLMGVPVGGQLPNHAEEYGRLERGPLYPDRYAGLFIEVPAMASGQVRDGVTIGSIPRVRLLSGGTAVAEPSCALCHAQRPATGAHGTHVNATTYGPHPAAGTNDCSECHEATTNNPTSPLGMCRRSCRSSSVAPGVSVTEQVDPPRP